MKKKYESSISIEAIAISGSLIAGYLESKGSSGKYIEMMKYAPTATGVLMNVATIYASRKTARMILGFKDRGELAPEQEKITRANLEDMVNDKTLYLRGTVGFGAKVGVETGIAYVAGRMIGNLF